MTIKMSYVPKGATHWQPRSDFSYESFYKKTSHGVSVFVVNPESDSMECNRWNGSLGRNHTEVATVIPIELINQHDHLQAENERLREELKQRVEFAYIEGFSDGRNDAELEQGNNAADEFKRSRALESLNKLLKGDENE